MEKTSKIKSCEFTKEWNSPNGTIYYHKLTFENGDIGAIGTKEKLPLKICAGTELTYTIEVDIKGNNKIKPIQQQKPQFNKSGFKAEPYEHKCASYALSYAKDLCIGSKIETKDMLPLADKLYEWLLSKKQEN